MLACASLFWPGLFRNEVPAFRDAFHFYYPQAVWLDQCALQGEYFPQWQCNESLGVSTVGETTSALYYPLRAFWLLPNLSVAQRFSVFAIAHLVLAGLGVHYACARMRLRKEAGWLAGACFALSCPVLFQHNNLVFLSSSAWLGFAIAEIACWLFRSEPDSHQPRLVVFSGAIAMMVLAGDPHTAVNILIVAVFLAAASAIAKRSALWFGNSLAWLVGVVLLAIGLSAVQSIQSLQWANQSHRWSNATQLDESLLPDAEQTTAPERGALDNNAPAQLLKILREPARRSTDAIYDFSLSPWHTLTSFWPTLGGAFSPQNARSFSLISAEGRMWIPSLFFGVLPMFLLFRGYRRSAKVKSTFFVIGAIFALFASLGNYSLGWLLRSVFDDFNAGSWSDHLPPDHYSSLYGLLAECLPGYHVFRYPAKWSVHVVAFATIAAAIRFDQLCDADLTRGTLVQRVVLLLSGLGVLITLACSNLLEEYVAARATVLSDAWLGAPNSSAITRQILFAFAVPVLVVGVLSLVRWRANKLQQDAMRAKLPLHAIVAWIGLLETFVVASYWCSFIPVESMKPAGAWTSDFVWSDASEANIAADRWLTSITEKPPIAIADYQREFALGKLGLLSNQHNLASMLSIEPQRLKQLRVGLAKLDNLSAVQPELDAALAWLGVEKRLVRERESSQRASFRWQTVPEAKPLCELRFDDSGNSQAASIKWKWLRCGQLEVEVESPTKCRLLVRQLNDDGWKVVTNPTQSPQVIRDSSGVFIECAIDAGKSRLVLQRIEWPLVLGVSLSILSLLMAAGISSWQQLAASGVINAEVPMHRVLKTQ